ncbi:MAG TPA: hypothetical protein VN923_01000 [Thermoanaerobaculia bacterium]|nr:hypothetical protein [Thermoanaerobaculia bacterium]
MDQSPRELLLANLPLIRELVAFSVHRHRLPPSHFEDLEGWVRMRLIENDYAIIASWRRTSSFRTFMTVVVQRLVLDYCNHVWGKWRPSARAVRLGPLAVALEEQLYRDGRSFDEACEELGARFGATRAELIELFGKLPRRRRPTRLQPLDPDLAVPSSAPNPEEWTMRRADGTAVARAVIAGIRRMPAGDRMLLLLRFTEGHSVTAIARALSMPDRRLFRRFDGIMKRLRRELREAGFDRDDVKKVLANKPNLDFELYRDAGDDPYAADAAPDKRRRDPKKPH